MTTAAATRQIVKNASGDSFLISQDASGEWYATQIDGQNNYCGIPAFLHAHKLRTLIAELSAHYSN